MPTIRQNKIGKLLQKELGDILDKNSRALAPGKLITVTTVRVTPDLGLAKVYLSIFPTQENEKALATIEHNAKTIRHDLGTRVRHQLRIIPELQFFIDDSLDYVEKIDNLLKS